MEIRTSVTHPLRIGELHIENIPGVIGLTFCPGKTQENGWSGPWLRSLDLDLLAIKDWGANVVVTLMELKEFDLYGVHRLPKKVQELGMAWVHMPIQDETAPTKSFDLAWQTEGRILADRLMAGQKILFHCKGGLGRTGTVSAKMLIEFGCQPDDAIVRVRKARTYSIDPGDQEDYVREQKCSLGLMGLSI